MADIPAWVRGLLGAGDSAFPRDVLRYGYLVPIVSVRSHLFVSE